MYAEAANALWAMHRRGNFSASDYAEAVATLQYAPIAVPYPMNMLMPAASRLAKDLDHPVYDCFYLALAIQTQYLVVTADHAFFNKARAHPYLSGFIAILANVAEDFR